VITAFLFDFNGTLMRSPTWIALEVRDLPRAAFALLAKAGHIPLLDEERLALAEEVFRNQRASADNSYRETSHVDDLTQMVEALALSTKVSTSLISETVAMLHRRCILTVELMAYTEETLQQLHELGLRLGIISNAAYSPFLTWTLEHFNILEYFEEIVVSADVNTRKPGLDIFKIALRRMELQPEETVYVGDDYRKDVVASKQLGIRAIWYQPNGDAPPPDSEVTPDAVVTGHDQIPALAKRWLSEA
jgi:putative hydrolase of the HAD superfamily